MLFAQLNFRRVGGNKILLRFLTPFLETNSAPAFVVARRSRRRRQRERSLKPERMEHFKWCSASNRLPPPTSPGFMACCFFSNSSPPRRRDCCISLCHIHPNPFPPPIFIVFLFSFIIYIFFSKNYPEMAKSVIQSLHKPPPRSHSIGE